MHLEEKMKVDDENFSSILRKITFYYDKLKLKSSNYIASLFYFNICINKVIIVTGDQRCFLFSLRPVMKIYPTLPHNDHFLYLNANQKALPNGLVGI